MKNWVQEPCFEALMVKWENQRGGSNALDIAGQIKAIQSSSNASKQNWCDDLEKTPIL